MDHQLRRLTSALAIASIQLTLIYMWVLAGIVKFVDADYQAGFPKRFEGSFLESLPGGILGQMYIIGAIELAAAALALIGLLRLEALRGSAKWTQLSLAVSAVTFAMLGFGLRVVKDFAGSANIYFYLAGTIVFMLYIDRAVAERRGGGSGDHGGRFRGRRGGGGGQQRNGPRNDQKNDQRNDQRSNQPNRSNSGPRPVTNPKPNAN